MNRTIGPPSYENWKAASQDSSLLGGYEVPLFTDAHITGEILEGFGPYQFLNPIAISSASGSITPGVILRVEKYLKISLPSTAEMRRTNDTLYHGGSSHDEIAALASLILGVRFKSGGITRVFGLNEDPRGKPLHYQMDRNPILLEGEGKRIIPEAHRTILLNDLNQLLTYSTLTPEDAIILVRASRLYQDALWIAESEPALAWVMFVSAIETAANHWRKKEYTPVEKLHASKPELEKILDEHGGQELVKIVAEYIVEYMGATKKFIDFVLAFLPSPPKNRPKFDRHPWSKTKIKKTLEKIYGYRSDALHGSRAFPAPMCMSPMISDGYPIEVPTGFSTSTLGGVWVKEDSPLLLHTFEYIVRGALLKWWASLIPEDSLK